MPRFHTVWDHVHQVQKDIPFTALEEQQRDEEEKIAAEEREELSTRSKEFDRAAALIKGDSATLKDVLSYLNLAG